MKKQITKDQRIINILSRVIEYGFELDATCPLAANVAAAEETLIEERDYDRIEVIECDRSYSHITYDDGQGYHFESDGEFINAGHDRDKNSYFKRTEGVWEETRIIDHNPGDVIYVRMYDVIDSNALVVALVARYEV